MPPKLAGEIAMGMDEMIKQMAESKVMLYLQWRALADALGDPLTDWLKRTVSEEMIQQAVQRVVNLIPNDRKIEHAVNLGLSTFLGSLGLQTYFENFREDTPKLVNPTLIYVGRVLAYIYMSPAGRRTCRETMVLDYVANAMDHTKDPRAVESVIYAWRVAASLADEEVILKFTGSRLNFPVEYLETFAGDIACVTELCRFIAVVGGRRDGRTSFDPAAYMKVLERFGTERNTAIAAINAWDGLLRGALPEHAKLDNGSEWGPDSQLQPFRSRDPKQSGDTMMAQVQGWLARSPLKNDVAVVTAVTELLSSCARWCTADKLKELITLFISRLETHRDDVEITVHAINGLCNAWVELLRIAPKKLKVDATLLNPVVHAAYRHLASDDVVRAALHCFWELLTEQNTKMVPVLRETHGMMELLVASMLRDFDHEDILNTYAGWLAAQYAGQSLEEHEAHYRSGFFQLMLNLAVDVPTTRQGFFVIQTLTQMLTTQMRLTKRQRAVLCDTIPDKAYFLLREYPDVMDQAQVAICTLYCILNVAYSEFKKLPVSRENVSRIRRAIGLFSTNTILVQYGTAFLSRCTAEDPADDNVAKGSKKVAKRFTPSIPSPGVDITPPSSNSLLPGVAAEMIENVGGDYEKLEAAFEVLMRCFTEKIPIDRPRIARGLLKVIGHFTNMASRQMVVNYVMLIQNGAGFDRTVGLEIRKRATLEGLLLMVSKRMDDQDILDGFCGIMESTYSKIITNLGNEPLAKPTKAEFAAAFELQAPNMLIQATRNSSKRDMHSAAFKALWGLGGDVNEHVYHSQLFAMGLTSAIVNSMRTHLDDLLLHMLVVSGWALLYCHKKSRSECPVDAAWAEPDLLPTVAEVMRRHEGEEIVQRGCCLVLENMFNKAPMNLPLYEIARSSGVLQACERIAAKHRNNNDLLQYSGKARLAMSIRDGIDVPGMVMKDENGTTIRVKDLAKDQAADNNNKAGAGAQGVAGAGGAKKKQRGKRR